MEKDSTKRDLINFWYLNQNHTIDYKEQVVNWLYEHFEDFRDVAKPSLWVDFYDFKPNHKSNITGHVFVSELEEDSKKLQTFYNYVLSKERTFIPIGIACTDKQDYSLIEEILKQNYGRKGKLTNDFLGIGKLFNQKTIKGR
ncbi:hypothetical protein KAT80_00570 [Candidatus Pacearchaeota archaeon]|nr:hypothetical protein [Candidatus Pacearchaeota archaeon]